MGFVGVGVTTRVVGCNQRLVATVSRSVGAAPRLRHWSPKKRYFAGNRRSIVYVAHGNSIADAVPVHWLLNQRFAPN